MNEVKDSEVKTAEDKLADIAQLARGKAEELAKTAGRTIDKARGPVRDAVAGTGTAIRNAARDSGIDVDNLHRRISGVWSNVRDVVRKNPGAAVLASLGVGLLLGVRIRNRG